MCRNGLLVIRDDPEGKTLLCPPALPALPPCPALLPVGRERIKEIDECGFIWLENIVLMKLQYSPGHG